MDLVDNEIIDGADELVKLIELLTRLDRDARVRVLASAAIFYGVKEDIT